MFRSLKERYFFLIFLACLLVHMLVSTVGWNNTILDAHGFRQSQTALSTYYFVKDGFRLDYETPVFGPPWSIPLEFPLYQMLVAAIARPFSFPLDQTGRFVSLFMFYVFIAGFFAVLKQFNLSLEKRLFILSAILVSPMYLFWSRTFMIESTALVLVTWYAWAVLSLTRKKRGVFFFLSIILGGLAAVTKATTFASVLPAIILAFWFFSWPSGKRKRLALLSNLMVSMIVFGLPLLLGAGWTIFAETIRVKNPLAAEFLTGSSLRYWMYGNLKERMDPAVWLWILKTVEQTVIGSRWIIVAAIIVAILRRPYRLLILGSFGAFLLGPLFFTNVYYVHDYYLYANGFFLLLGIVFALLSLKESRYFRSLTALVLIPAFLLFLLTTYKKTYYPLQATNAYSVATLGNIVGTFTEKDDVLLIHTYDWNPQLPYYARRRAIIDWWYLPLSDARIQKVVGGVGKERIGAVYISKGWPSFIDERIKYFGLEEKPVFTNQDGALYVKKTDTKSMEDKYERMNKILYEGISSITPNAVSSSVAVDFRFVDGRKVLFIHAPGEVTVTIPKGKTMLHAQFGIMPGAYGKPNAGGVGFHIDLVKGTQSQTLFAKDLRPNANKFDQGMQATTIKLSDCPCALSLKTLTLDSPFWNWSYWTDIVIQ